MERETSCARERVPVHLHRHRDGEDSLAAFIPDLHGDLMDLTPRQPVLTDLSGGVHGFLLSIVQAVQFNPLTIGDQVVTLTDIEVELRHSKHPTLTNCGCPLTH